MSRHRFKWIVEFSVDKTWVEDGFELTADRAKNMLENDLQFAYGHELGARILKAPPQKDIAKVQGYKSVKAKREADRAEGLTK